VITQYKVYQIPEIMSLLLVGSALLAGILVISFMMRSKPFHVKVDPMEMKVLGVNIFPAIVFMFNIMPEGMRRSILAKQDAPKPGNVSRDLYDVTGETPYKIDELKPGKLWQVTYSYENKALTDKAAKEEAKGFGMDPTSEAFHDKCLKAAAQFGDEVVEVVKKDLKTSEEWFRKETLTNEELIEACKDTELKCFVVKLNSGSLLLYSTIRIREEVGFGTWLDSLGKLEWIVVASSYHTLSVQSVASRYPDAKIIGAPAAQAKLNVINALVRNKFDYNCTDETEMKTLNSILEKEGVELFYVAGDICTNAIVAVAHNVALECDLVYGHHDGEGFNTITKERFRELRPEDWGMRLFRLALMCRPNTPHGHNATYRYLMMDPAGMGAMMYDKPARDGSTCLLMANSLRRMLNLKFDSAYGAHADCQTREDFRKNIDAAWNWLDGESLL